MLWQLYPRADKCCEVNLEVNKHYCLKLYVKLKKGREAKTTNLMISHKNWTTAAAHNITILQ